MAIERIESVTYEVEDLSDCCLTGGFQPGHYIPAALTIEEQRKKLEHVETIATMVWGNEA